MFTDMCGEVVGTIFTIQNCNKYLEKMGLNYFSTIRVRLMRWIDKSVEFILKSGDLRQ